MQDRDLVPAEPFAQIAQKWLGKQGESGNPLALLADEMKMDKEGLRKIVTGKRERIPFDIAEKLLLLCGGHWETNAEVYAIYADFDLKWLDAKKPCAVAA